MESEDDSASESESSDSDSGRHSWSQEGDDDDDEMEEMEEKATAAEPAATAAGSAAGDANDEEMADDEVELDATAKRAGIDEQDADEEGLDQVCSLLYAQYPVPAQPLSKTPSDSLHKTGAGHEFVKGPAAGRAARRRSVRR